MSVGFDAAYVAFTLSGMAGLSYEILWSRYLALYLGSSAYAQVVVLTVYMGGMAVGALAIGDVSRRLRRPWAAYAGAEALLAVLALVFHPTFVHLSRASYDTLLPALGSPTLSVAARWGIGALLLLPPAVVLGATFPLMAAGLVRRDALRPGQGVAGAYLANTLGGALGVLLTGFLLIPRLGMPGALRVSAALNAGAALLVLALRARADLGEGPPPRSSEVEETSPAAAPARVEGEATRSDERAPVRLLLTVSFGTALASFAYEIGWIRLLTLALGGATHAFELMLSAFLTGLGLGAVLIRPVADRSPRPLRLLGAVQWATGIMALATLPFYGWVFDAVAYLVDALPARDGGYLLFNLSRYALALAVMLPATVLAGTTLPLLTGTLLRAGSGERTIGRVYGVNTLGAVVGTLASALVGLPALGMKGLLVGGAAVDMALGVWLFGRSGERWRRPVTLALVGIVACTGVALGVGLRRSTLVSGVFRFGSVPGRDSWTMAYYRDGRTATVGVHWRPDTELLVLTTNGKPDASLGARWLEARPNPGVVRPLAAHRDATTQVLAPLVGLAHVPGARRVANVGHGSGMSGSALLSGPAVDSLVTVEIEPAMVEGSLSFMPANADVFRDGRSTFVFDDARAYLSYAGAPFDLVFAEPSNPWVSGASSLFTEEFYREVRRHLAPGGVLAQWMQLYEIDDDLVLSVLSAIDATFGAYRGYLVGDADLLVVATPEGPLPEPDWDILGLPPVREILTGVPPFLPPHLDPLVLFDASTLRPVLDGGVRVNSDFDPFLDTRAERARFREDRAEGLLALGTARVDLRRIFAGERAPPDSAPTWVPAKGLTPSVRRGLTAWLQWAERTGEDAAPDGYPEWRNALARLHDYLAEVATAEAPTDWKAWTAAFEAVEGNVHGGTAGWVDTTFYAATERYLNRVDAPPDARAAVDLLHGVGAWDFPRAASAADILVPGAAQGERWLSPGLLLDAAVVAYLETDRPADARRALEALTPVSGRRADDVRVRLLAALVRRRER